MEEMNYEDLRNEVLKLLDSNKYMVLATCSHNRVTARTMSIVHKDLKLYFQTGRSFVKSKQISENPNVALCAGNMQIEGTASGKGHPHDEDNAAFLDLYRENHKTAYDRYSGLEDEIVFEVCIKSVALWKYMPEGDRPYRDFLDVAGEKAHREYISYNPG